jgi:lysyl-tRNA synthetase class 2
LQSGSSGDWRPTASLENLRLRARILTTIRAFFESRGVLEVETPLLSGATVTDPHILSMSSRYGGPGAPHGRVLYLQTSPEYAMKRLLASSSGPIYQICKAFRDGESGRLHTPEFTILEWYRPGFDHHRLMNEMDELLGEVLGLPAAERLSYSDVFQRYIGVDPHTASLETLEKHAATLGLTASRTTEKDDWLNLLMAQAAEPKLGRGRPTFVFDYPASQAALARIREGNPPVAERFEVYVEGLELANGFHELADGVEQRRRFEADLEKRRGLGRDSVPIDEYLLGALEAGMPSGAGVALGIDRLVMIAAGADALPDVLAFPIDRA